MTGAFALPPEAKKLVKDLLRVHADKIEREKAVEKLQAQLEGHYSSDAAIIPVWIAS